MDTRTGYPQRVPRSKWSPPDDETATKVADVVERYRRWHEAEREYKEALAAIAQPTGPVPIAHLAEQLDIERKTVYRHLGRSMT
jgi:transcriptional regulator of acetoin/glycerol metabolism